MFSTQRLQVLEILEILQVCQLLASKIFRKYKQNECQNGRRDIRGIGGLRKIPDSVWPNTWEIQAK